MIGMTEQETEALLERLERRLGLTEPDEDVTTVLMDELRDAEGELKLYLGCRELGEELHGKLVELAAVFYLRDRSDEAGRSGSSYAEGQVSMSESYFGPREYRAAVSEIMQGLARYRRVSC